MYKSVVIALAVPVLVLIMLVVNQKYMVDKLSLFADKETASKSLLMCIDKIFLLEIVLLSAYSVDRFTRRRADDEKLKELRVACSNAQMKIEVLYGLCLHSATKLGSEFSDSLTIFWDALQLVYQKESELGRRLPLPFGFQEYKMCIGKRSIAYVPFGEPGHEKVKEFVEEVAARHLAIEWSI